jgi:hypothetical protein
VASRGLEVSRDQAGGGNAIISLFARDALFPTWREGRFRREEVAHSFEQRSSIDNMKSPIGRVAAGNSGNSRFLNRGFIDLIIHSRKSRRERCRRFMQI